jgi:AcrR family transcriptional regulator
MVRRTQEERREDTRRRLLAGAARVFAKRGFNAASVSEISAAAGCSTGALYVHFESKEKLFLALLEEGIAPWSSGYAAELAPAPDAQARAQAAVTHWAQLLEQAPQTFLLFVEFWSVAVRDPELRARFAGTYDQIRQAMAGILQPTDGDARTGLSRAELAAAFVALADGFALQRMADPTAVPDELVLKAARLLFAPSRG